MTRYKLELEFEAEGITDAFDFINGFDVTLVLPGQGVVVYELRDLEGAFKMSGAFAESKEPAPFVPQFHGTREPTPQITWTVNSATGTGAQQAEKDVRVMTSGVDPLLKEMTGL